MRIVSDRSRFRRKRKYRIANVARPVNTGETHGRPSSGNASRSATSDADGDFDFTESAKWGKQAIFRKRWGILCAKSHKEGNKND